MLPNPPTRPPRVSSRDRTNANANVADPFPVPAPPPPPVRVPQASPAIAADNDLAQTAAFSGGDLLLRGALAVTALGGAAFVSRGASAKTSAVMDSGAASASGYASMESALAAAEASAAEAEAESARLRDALANSKAAEASLAARLEEALERQQTVESDLGARVSRSEADAARFKAQAEASAAKGERAGNLVESLEAQIDALQRQLEEEKNGVGVKLMDEATRAAQLADQLQLTQRTANKLAVEVEGYRKDADDFNAKRALAHLQLKAAQEKIESLTKQRDEAESKADERVKAKAMELTTMRRAKERAEARAAELEAKLRETETRLELEVAGSLAAAKREAMAMLDPNYDPNVALAEQHSDEEENRDALADAAADDDDELDVFLPSGSVQAGGSALDRDDFGFPPPPEGEETYAEASGAFARGALADLDTPGEWLQAYDTERELHYWYNNVTMETAWELPAGARVRGGAAESGGDDDLPRHFEGPSGLNAR